MHTSLFKNNKDIPEAKTSKAQIVDRQKAKRDPTLLVDKLENKLKAT